MTRILIFIAFYVSVVKFKAKKNIKMYGDLVKINLII